MEIIELWKLWKVAKTMALSAISNSLLCDLLHIEPVTAPLESPPTNQETETERLKTPTFNLYSRRKKSIISPTPIISLETNNGNNPNSGSSLEIQSNNDLDLPIALRKGPHVLTLYQCRTYHPNIELFSSYKKKIKKY